MPGQESELHRLVRHATAQLLECESQDRARFLLGLQPALLDVSLDRPIDTTDQPYEILFERIMKTERVPPNA